MRGCTFLFTFCFFLIRSQETADVAGTIVVDHRGDDDTCAVNSSTPCATFSQALSLASDNNLTSLVIYYGNSSADNANEISTQIFNAANSNLSNFTIVTNGSISYPFAQLSSNARPLLTFISVETLSLFHLTFQVQTVGCLNISGSTSLNISGCSFAVSSSQSFTSPTPYIYIRDTDDVTFSSYATDSDVVNTTFGSLTAASCAGIDVDNATTFTATNITMNGLTGSRGAGIRFGGRVNNIYITCCKFTTITSQNTTNDLGNGGALYLPTPETQDTTCCVISNSTFGDCEAYIGDGGAIYSCRTVELYFCSFTRASKVTATMIMLDGTDSISVTDIGLRVSNVDFIVVASNFTADQSLSAAEEVSVASSRANRENTKHALIHLIQCNSIIVEGKYISLASEETSTSGGIVNVETPANDDEEGIYYTCNFKNSNGVDAAGAIHCESVSNIMIQDSVFTQSRGKKGSALYVSKYNGSVLTTNSVLLSSIECNGGSTTQNYGPHFYIEEAQRIDIEYCSFSKHGSNINGGSIYIGSCTTYAVIAECSFNNTRAKNGGAIYIDACVPNVTMSNLYITSCQATTAGGGIMIASNSSSSGMTVTLENIEVSSCSADVGAGVTISETVSAVTDQYCTVSINNITLSKNTASEFAGGLFVQKTLSGTAASSFAHISSNADATYQVTVTGATFSENTCSASDFSGNESYPWTVEPCGGAFAAMFNHSTSESTSARTLRLSNADTYYVYLSNCTFTDNSNGAILTLNEMPVLIEDASFSGNTASYSSTTTTVDAICQSSTLHIHNVTSSDSRVILCDSACQSTASADSDSDQCYSVPASNVTANVTVMKTGIYPRMHQVSFTGKNIFPFQPILAVSLSSTAPSSDSSLLRALARNSQVVRRSNSADYVYTALVPDTTTGSIGLNLTHTLNLGDLQETAPDAMYLFVSIDGGMTWNDNSATEVMTITWESNNYSESSSLSTGEIFAIIVGVVGVIGACCMVVYEIIRRRKLRDEDEQENDSTPTAEEQQHLMQNSQTSYSQ